LIIDDDFDHSLSSLKKNRKATFDVSYRGVLYSAFFVSLYVSMMESIIELGGPFCIPHRSDPQGVRIVVCVLIPTQNVLYFVLNRVCILGVSVGHVLGGVRFGGVFVWGHVLGVILSVPNWGCFWGPVLGVPK